MASTTATTTTITNSSFDHTNSATLAASPYDKAVWRFSKLVYGSNNELPNSEKLLLEQLPSKSRVLTICGGADNFLTLLATCDNVASIVCVDQNPLQLALGELKLVLACSALSTEEILDFLGMNHSLQDCPKRLELYKRVIEPELQPSTAQLFCDNLLYEIEMGIAQCGAESNGYRYYRYKLATLGFSAEDLWNHQFNPNALKEAFRAGVGTPDDLWKASCIGDTYPEIYRENWGFMIGVFQRVFLQSLLDPKFANTFTKSLMIRSRYDQSCPPEWILTESRERVRQRRDCITFCSWCH